MNNTKRSEIILKVIERIHEHLLNMQITIDSTLVDVCREENVSPEMVFYGFYFLL